MADAGAEVHASQGDGHADRSRGTLADKTGSLILTCRTEGITKALVVRWVDFWVLLVQNQANVCVSVYIENCSKNLMLFFRNLSWAICSTFEVDVVTYWYISFRIRNQQTHASRFTILRMTCIVSEVLNTFDVLCPNSISKLTLCV